MRKWPLIVMALVVLGCAGGGNGGGGGTGGTGGGTSGGTTGRDAATVMLDETKPGYLDVYLLPGQGRGRAPGSLTAEIDVIRFLSDLGDQAEAALAPNIFIKLDGENIHGRGINSDGSVFSPPYPDSKTFNTMQMTMAGFFVEDDAGVPQPVPNSALFGSFQDEFRYTAFRARTTALQIFLNDAMFSQTVTGINWDSDLFLSQNRNVASGKVQGFLADYVQFDISAVPNKPLIPTGTQFPPQSPNAQTVFFSGDGYCVGDKDPRGVNGSNGLFIFLTPTAHIEGFFRPQDATTQVKSFELKQASPQVIGEIRLITALKGIYRNYTEVFSNLHAFEFILMPKSGDGPKQDIVIISRTGPTITNMWFGTADYSPSAGPSFRVYPIRNLYPASIVGEIRGTLPRADLIGVGGTPVSTSGPNWWQKVRGGKFKFNGTPSGITKLSGDFVTFRV